MFDSDFPVGSSVLVVEVSYQSEIHDGHTVHDIFKFLGTESGRVWETLRADCGKFFKVKEWSWVVIEPAPPHSFDEF
jgi:hypothetical protein